MCENVVQGFFRAFKRIVHLLLQIASTLRHDTDVSCRVLVCGLKRQHETLSVVLELVSSVSGHFVGSLKLRG